MPFELDPLYVIYVFVALAAGLFVEGIYLMFFNTRSYRKNINLRNQAAGVSDYNDPAFLPVQDTEYNAEIYYGVHVANWLTVRPNLQFIRHPGGVNQVDDALVAGLKIQSSF